MYFCVFSFKTFSTTRVNRRYSRNCNNPPSIETAISIFFHNTILIISPHQWKNFVEWAFNNHLTLSSSTAVEMWISAFLFGPLIRGHRIIHDTFLTSIQYMQRSLMDMAMKYMFTCHLTRRCISWIYRSGECRVTLQECFPLTKLFCSTSPMASLIRSVGGL